MRGYNVRLTLNFNRKKCKFDIQKYIDQCSYVHIVLLHCHCNFFMLNAGIGALYVRRRPRVRVEALQSGGGQERGMRSGTLPAPLVVGLGAACEVSQQEMEVSPSASYMPGPVS